MAEDPVQLTYQPNARPRWYRWVGRVALLLAGTVLTLWLAHGDWYARARLQVALLSAQRQCMNFTAPPDRVAMEFDPVAGKRLMAVNGYQSFDNWLEAPVVIWSEPDVQLRKLANASDPVERFSEIYDGPNPQRISVFGDLELVPNYPETIFLHALHTRAGERLVAIEAQPVGDGVQLTAYVWKPAGWTTGVVSCNTPINSTSGPGLFGTTSGGGNSAGSLFGPTSNAMSPVPSNPNVSIDQDVLRVYFGQVDPQDPARFIIHYETAIGKSRVTGKLMPDDTVELQDQH